MKQFFSGTVLARKLDVDWRTLRKDIHSGAIRPDAYVDGKPVYDLDNVLLMIADQN